VGHEKKKNRGEKIFSSSLAMFEYAGAQALFAANFSFGARWFPIFFRAQQINLVSGQIESLEGTRHGRNPFHNIGLYGHVHAARSTKIIARAILSLCS
jgi:hypothetical protein